MTIEEAKAIFGDEDGYVSCNVCPWNGRCKLDACNGESDAYREIVSYFYGSEPKKCEGTVAPTNQVNDMVNHPSHYTQGGIECIDAMVSAYGKEAVANYCIINAFKYIWRSHKKNGREDVKKAKWYLDKHLELTEEV